MKNSAFSMHKGIWSRAFRVSFRSFLRLTAAYFGSAFVLKKPSLLMHTSRTIIRPPHKIDPYHVVDGSNFSHAWMAGAAVWKVFSPWSIFFIMPLRPTPVYFLRASSAYPITWSHVWVAQRSIWDLYFSFTSCWNCCSASAKALCPSNKAASSYTSSALVAKQSLFWSYISPAFAKAGWTFSVTWLWA